MSPAYRHTYMYVLCRGSGYSQSILYIMVPSITLLHQLPLEEPGELAPNKPAALLYNFIYMFFNTTQNQPSLSFLLSLMTSKCRASTGSEAILCWRNKYEIQSLRPRKPRHPWSCRSVHGSPGPKKCASSRSRPLELLSLTCFHFPSFFCLPCNIPMGFVYCFSI